jgi:hypothetical protein
MKKSLNTFINFCRSVSLQSAFIYLVRSEFDLIKIKSKSKLYIFLILRHYKFVVYYGPNL